MDSKIENISDQYEELGSGVYRVTVGNTAEVINHLEKNTIDGLLCDVDGVLLGLPKVALKMLPWGQKNFLSREGKRLVNYISGQAYPWSFITNRRIDEIDAKLLHTQDLLNELDANDVNSAESCITGLNRQVGENGLSGFMRTNGSWQKLQIKIDEIVQNSEGKDQIKICIVSDEFAHLQLRKSYNKFKRAYNQLVKPIIGQRTADQIYLLKQGIKRRLGFDSFTFYGDYRFAKEVREYALTKSNGRDVEIVMIRLNMLAKMTPEAAKSFVKRLQPKTSLSQELFAEA